MALALTWGGFADTDLRLAEFLFQDHTVIVRFMPQYPNGYGGPLIGETGITKYVIGQGRGDGSHTRLILQVGSRSQRYDAPLVAGQWHHLAVVRKDNLGTLYLNGTRLPDPIQMPAPKANEMVDVKGTIRFGRRRVGRLLDERQGQFYGLIDEAAVYTRAFTDAEVQQAANTPPALTGEEANLLAGWTFTTKKQSHKRLARPVALGQNASLVQPSAARDSTQDRELLPEPPSEFNAELPLPLGTPWFVSQGYNGGASHWDIAEFCLDLSLAGAPPDKQFPDGTAGAPVSACAEGKVDWLEPGALEVGDGEGRNWFYGHLLEGSTTQAGIKLGQTISKGQKLGGMGKTGTGSEHLHVAFGEVIPGLHPRAGVTIPAAFTKYQRLDTDADGNPGWMSVSVGVPQQGEVIRRPHPSNPFEKPMHEKWRGLLGWQQQRLEEIERFGRPVLGRPTLRRHGVVEPQRPQPRPT